MAYDFTTTGYVRVANNSSIDDLTAGTYIWWLKGDGVGDQIMAKGVEFSALKLISLTRPSRNDVDTFFTRATTDQAYRTNDTPIATGGTLWQMLAITFDASAQHIYVGDVSTKPVESTYSSSTVGSGAFTADTGGTNGLVVANRDDLGHAAASPPMGFFGMWNRAMTLAEIITQWDHLHVSSGNVIFWLMDRAAATTQPDHSGTGNNATAQSGLTYVTNPPIVSPWDDGDYQLSVSAPAVAANATLLQVTNAHQRIHQLC